MQKIIPASHCEMCAFSDFFTLSLSHLITNVQRNERKKNLFHYLCRSSKEKRKNKIQFVVYSLDCHAPKIFHAIKKGEAILLWFLLHLFYAHTNCDSQSEVHMEENISMRWMMLLREIRNRNRCNLKKKMNVAFFSLFLSLSSSFRVSSITHVTWSQRCVLWDTGKCVTEVKFMKFLPFLLSQTDIYAFEEE